MNACIAYDAAYNTRANEETSVIHYLSRVYVYAKLHSNYLILLLFEPPARIGERECIFYYLPSHLILLKYR